MVATCIIKWWCGVNKYSVTLCGNSRPLSVPFLYRTSQSSWLGYGNSANINLTFRHEKKHIFVVFSKNDFWELFPTRAVVQLTSMITRGRFLRSSGIKTNAPCISFLHGPFRKWKLKDNFFFLRKWEWIIIWTRCKVNEWLGSVVWLLTPSSARKWCSHELFYRIFL